MPLLSKMLTRDPKSRISSAALLTEIDDSLPALIRSAAEKAQRDGRFSPLEELDQIDAYLSSLPQGVVVPVQKRSRLRGRLRDIEQTQGFSASDRARAERLAGSLA
jgi:hypothetical protein